MDTTYEVRNTLGQSLGTFCDSSDAMAYFETHTDADGIVQNTERGSCIIYTRKDYEEYLEAKARYSHV